MTLRPGQKFTDRSIIGLLEPRLEVQRSVISKTAQGQIGPRFLNFMADITVMPVPLVPAHSCRVRESLSYVIYKMMIFMYGGWLSHTPQKIMKLNICYCPVNRICLITVVSVLLQY